MAEIGLSCVFAVTSQTVRTANYKKIELFINYVLNLRMA
jgi:hypothetical protein